MNLTAPTAWYRTMPKSTASRLHALVGPNPLLNVILAFWALWHCRHARPPQLL